MTPISHALIPVCLGSRWIPKREGSPTWRIFLLVAASGMMPDLLNPHLRLEARHEVWSHSLAAWGGFALVVAVLLLWRFRGRGYGAIAVLCVFAYGAHLACDAITGGIGLMQPFRDTIIGRHVLPFWAWTVSDVGFTVLAYFLFRRVPLGRQAAPMPPARTRDGGRNGGS
jgi:membrane-bound metal-dependent hydrolase YbcI (DUF457 family)